MEVNGPQNNLPNVNDVLDEVNDVADLANQNALQAQTAMGTIFFALIQRMLSTAQENSSSGA